MIKKAEKRPGKGQTPKKASKARPRRSANTWSFIGDRLKELKEERSVTGAYLAGKTGISVSQISRYMNDTAQAPSEKVIQLARILNVTPAYLMGESNDRTIMRGPLPDHVAQLHRRANRMSKRVMGIPDPVRQERVLTIAESLIN